MIHRGRRPAFCAGGSAVDQDGLPGGSSALCQERPSRHETRAHHRYHGPGRQLPRRTPPDEGLRGPRHRPPGEHRVVRAHRPPVRQGPPPPGRPPRPALPHRRDEGLEPGRGLQPRRPELRAHELEAALPHRRVHGHRGDAGAGGDPPAGQGPHPLLPGVVERDVRQGPGRPADGGHALLPAEPVRRGQALRPLDHDQLPRELRHVLRVAASCSTTSRRGAGGSSSPAR